MNFDLYYSAIAADKAFQSALVERYGKANAGTYRYWPEWKHPEHICRLGVAFRKASDAWHDHVVEFRRSNAA